MNLPIISTVLRDSTDLECENEIRDGDRWRETLETDDQQTTTDARVSWPRVHMHNESNTAYRDEESVKLREISAPLTLITKSARDFPANSESREPESQSSPITIA